MTAMKRDDVTASVEGENEASQGVKRLHLSVTRMKKLRASVKGGPVGVGSVVAQPVSEVNQPNGTASLSWM
jgi:hypothetical protein